MRLNQLLLFSLLFQGQSDEQAKGGHLHLVSSELGQVQEKASRLLSITLPTNRCSRHPVLPPPPLTPIQQRPYPVTRAKTPPPPPLPPPPHWSALHQHGPHSPVGGYSARGGEGGGSVEKWGPGGGCPCPGCGGGGVRGCVRTRVRSVWRGSGCPGGTADRSLTVRHTPCIYHWGDRERATVNTKHTCIWWTLSKFWFSVEWKQND